MRQRDCDVNEAGYSAFTKSTAAPRTAKLSVEVLSTCYQPEILFPATLTSYGTV